MTSILERIEKELVEKWQQRQDVIDWNKVQQAQDQEQARVKAEARDKLLPAVRKREQAYNDRVIAWLDEGLDLCAEERELRKDVALAYGRPRAFRLTARLQACVKSEKNRLRVFLRGPRNYGTMRKERARQLRSFGKEQARIARSMAGGDGSRYAAGQRIRETQAAADRWEGKPPADENAMLVTAEQARSL